MITACFFIGYLMDKFGRKFTMVLGGSVVILAFLLLIFDTESTSLDFFSSFLLGSFGEFF